MPNREWRFVDERGPGSIGVPTRFEVNDAVAALTSAEQGDGITNALSYMVAEAIDAGRLVSVLDRYTPPAVPVNLLYAPSRLMAPKLRAFVDFAAPRLAAALEALPLPKRA